MFIFIRTLFFLCVAFYFLCPPTYAQTAPSPPVPLAVQVDAAMARARAGDLHPSINLLRQADQVLPLLEKYADDPSPAVHIVLGFFAKKGHSQENVKIYSALVAQYFPEAIDNLYRDYTTAELQRWGGPELKENLFNYVLSSHFDDGNEASIKAVILLSVFPPDPEVKAFLEDLRANRLYYYVPENGRGSLQGYTVKRQVAKKTQVGHADPVVFSLPIDLTLSEEGDTDAVGRVIQSIPPGEVDSTITFLIESVRFIHQKKILLAMVELLKDKRPSKFHIPPKTVITVASFDAQANTSAAPSDDTLRVCDIALTALAKNTRIDVGIPDLQTAITTNPRTSTYRRYEDSELNTAYLALKAGLALAPSEASQ